MTGPEFILLFSLNSWVPNFVRAVKLSGFTDILKELEQEASGSYSYYLFPLCCKCCTLISAIVYITVIFQSYVIYYMLFVPL